MNAAEFQQRTKQYALRIIRLCDSFPKQRSAEVMVRQLMRAGTSVGANYRAACRARSKAEYISKLGIVAEECDESIYWMELLIEANIAKTPQLAELLKEGNEILAMVIASIISAKKQSRK